MAEQPDKEDVLRWAREVREYAWSWFSTHANQRMQTLNFFLVAMAFLATAYGTTISRAPVVAAGVAAVGLLISLAFHKLDYRNRELVKLGESALRQVEQVYEKHTSFSEVRLADLAEVPGSRFLGTFRWSIMFIQGTLAAGFLAALLYAIVKAAC